MDAPWSLTSLYQSFDDNAFKADVKQCDELIVEYEQLSQTLLASKNLSTHIADYLHLQQKLNAHFEKLFAYCSLTLSANTQDEHALQALHVLQEKANRLTVAQITIQEFLGNISDYSTFSEEIITEHLFFLQDLATYNPYLLDAKTEELIANLSLTGSTAFARLRETLTSKKTMSFNGKLLHLPAIRNLLRHSDASIRKLAFETEIKAYQEMEDSLAACLSGIKGEVLMLSNLRGYESVLQETLLSARLSHDTLTAMMGSIEDCLPQFQAFLKLKATALGYDEALPFYDLYAPLGTASKTYSYEEACSLVTTVFNSFSFELGHYAKHAIDSQWIDVYPRPNKVGGAFCQTIHAIKESRFLLNYGETFNDVSTLAHELGHGFHGQCLANGSSLNATYPMPLAETASIFCETLLQKYMQHHSDETDLRLMLERSLTDATQLIVDIYARFLFEQQLFEARKSGPLTAKELCELMLDAQKKAYGDAIQPSTFHPYMWANKPHYYSAGMNYYNYPYAFGLLLSKGLYARYQEAPSTFPLSYKQFLSLSGSETIENVAKSIDIDLSSLSFWQHALQTIIEDIDLFKKLVKTP